MNLDHGWVGVGGNLSRGRWVGLFGATVAAMAVLWVGTTEAGWTPGGRGEPPVLGTDVGQMYPDFRLPKLDGTMGRLSDYRGRKVLLMHFASW